MLITVGSQDPELSNRLGLRTLSWNHNSALFHILFVLLSLPRQAVFLLPSDSAPMAITPIQDPEDHSNNAIYFL